MIPLKKECSKCGEVKSLDQYDKHKSCKYGVCSYCKVCDRKANKKWKCDNAEQLKSSKSEHYRSNKDRISQQKKDRYRRDRETILAQKQRYYRENRERLIERMKEYHQQRKGTPEACRNEYFNKRRKEDPLFNITQRVRTRIGHMLRAEGLSKKAKTTVMIGCDWETLKDHLESQFTEGMTWDNRGEWHIDHIIPLSSASTEEGLMDLCHFTNLQPLWAGDNLRKGSKVPEATLNAQRAL